MAILAAREDLLAFIMLMDPSFHVAPHHRIICDELMAVERNENQRLMIFVAPRSSKSLISSVYFPAWCFGRKPNIQWIEAAHSSDLAKDWGRMVRDLISEPTYQAVFPNTEVKSDNSAADKWATTKKGSFLSAGAGMKIAGYGAHIGVMDDPLSEQDAWSKAKRDSINSWYPGGFRSRIMPNTGRIVLLNTRWHEEDLAGYNLNVAKNNPLADQWRVVNIPALNDSESLPLLKEARLKLIEQGYLPPSYPEPKLGETFWPGKATEDDDFYWSTEALIQTKNTIPEYQWNALYMQSPSALDGGIFKRDYWQEWNDSDPPHCDCIIMSMDTAFSTRTSADFSAITLWGIFRHGGKNNLILLGAKKGRWDYPTLRENAIDYYDEYEPDVIVVEKKGSGQSLIQDLRMRGLPIYEYQPDRDKVSRAHAVSPLFAQGLVWANTEKQWAMDVITECMMFPNSQHDDFVDTVTQAVLWMRNAAWVSPTDSPWYDEEEYGKIGFSRKHGRKYY